MIYLQDKITFLELFQRARATAGVLSCRFLDCYKIDDGKRIMIDPKALKEIVKRFASREDVRGVIVCDDEGLPIQTDLSTEMTEVVAAQVTSLVGRARKVVNGLNEGALHFIKIETSKGEVLVAPEDQWILIVLQGAPK